MNKIIASIFMIITLVLFSVSAVYALSNNKCTIMVDGIDEEYMHVSMTINTKLHIPSGEGNIYFSLPIENNKDIRINFTSSGNHTILYGFDNADTGHFIIQFKQEINDYFVSISIENVRINLEMSSDFDETKFEYHLYFADYFLSESHNNKIDKMLMIDELIIYDDNLSIVRNLETNTIITNATNNENVFEMRFTQDSPIVNFSCIINRPVKNFDALIRVFAIIGGLVFGIIGTVPFLSSFKKRWQIYLSLGIGILGAGILIFIFLNNHGMYQYDASVINILSGVLGLFLAVICYTVYRLIKKQYI